MPFEGIFLMEILDESAALFKMARYIMPLLQFYDTYAAVLTPAYHEEARQYYARWLARRQSVAAAAIPICSLFSFRGAYRLAELSYGAPFS